MPIYKKGQKENPGNHRPVSLTSVPGKVMEQITFSAIIWHVQDDQAHSAEIYERQDGFAWQGFGSRGDYRGGFCEKL